MGADRSARQPIASELIAVHRCISQSGHEYCEIQRANQNAGQLREDRVSSRRNTLLRRKISNFVTIGYLYTRTCVWICLRIDGRGDAGM